MNFTESKKSVIVKKKKNIVKEGERDEFYRRKTKSDKKVYFRED